MRLYVEESDVWSYNNLLPPTCGHSAVVCNISIACHHTFSGISTSPIVHYYICVFKYWNMNEPRSWHNLHLFLLEDFVQFNGWWMRLHVEVCIHYFTTAGLWIFPNKSRHFLSPIAHFGRCLRCTVHTGIWPSQRCRLLSNCHFWGVPGEGCYIKCHRLLNKAAIGRIWSLLISIHTFSTAWTWALSKSQTMHTVCFVVVITTKGSTYLAQTAPLTICPPVHHLLHVMITCLAQIWEPF